jgi:hypothetical protein
MIVTLYCDNSKLKIGQFELSSRFCTTANQDYNLLTYSQVFGRGQEILKSVWNRCQPHPICLSSLCKTRQFILFPFGSRALLSLPSFPNCSNFFLEGARSGQGAQIETARAARVNQTGLHWKARLISLVEAMKLVLL